MNFIFKIHSPRSYPRSASVRLLIVDDDLCFLAVLAKHLRREGYEVDAATEREEAEALLSNFSYSLVITDVSLSRVGFGGLDVLEFPLGMCDRPKMVVLGDRADPFLEAKATAQGADKFICKPVSLRRLSRVTAELVGATA